MSPCKSNPDSTGRRPIRQGALLGVALLACAIACGQPDFVRAADATDNEQLEQFLARLGLVDLRIQLLERSLQTASTPEAKLAMARRLADLYAERLMAHADDMAAYNDTLQRIEKLIQAVPAANTAPLQVMLLQADYNRAESLLTAWMNDPQAESSRAEAQQILDRISPSLLQFDTELNKQAEALLARMDETPEGDALTALELEAKRVQGIASRAAYFAAWANYYRGLLTRAAAGADPYLQARTIFRRIFGNDAALPPDTDPEGLGLESIWRARAMIGLGLSEAACGDPAACEVCFQLIEKGSVPPEIKEQAPYWYLRSLLNAGQYSAAEAYARSQVERMQPPASQGQVSFCAALVREGFTNGAATPDPARQALGPLGFSGLARLDQLAAITTLIEKYNIPAAQRTGLVLQWAAGQDQFAAAEKSKAAADYQTAADTLRTALKSPEVNTLLGPASRCRYTLAWCLYRLDQFEAAGREFTTALTGLSAARDALDVESAWMAFVSARRGADAARIAKENFQTMPISQLRLWGRVLSRMAQNELGIVSSYLSESDFAELGVTGAEVEGVIDYLNAVQNSPFSLIVTDRAGQLKGSLRTQRDDVDLTRIASVWGGGGHRKASGFTLGASTLRHLDGQRLVEAVPTPA